ncbi:unnamed protein product [Rotaria socialis]
MFFLRVERIKKRNRLYNKNFCFSITGATTTITTASSGAGATSKQDPDPPKPLSRKYSFFQESLNSIAIKAMYY